MIKPGCPGCFYWKPLYSNGRSEAGHNRGRLYACHHLLIEEHSRGCKPGADCIVRRKKKLRKCG